MESVDAFILKHDGYIKRITRAYARDAAEADELRQKAIIVIWRHFNQLSEQPEASVKSYLCKTVKNALIDMRRSEKRILPFETAQIIDSDFENAVVDRYLLMSVIHGLTISEQDITFKTYFLDMDSVEIGGQLGIKPSTVRSNRNRAIIKMRKLLKEKGSNQ